MPQGPPPAFKEFFITDPKTGKHSMKIQMYPAKNEDDDAEENELDSDDDEFDSNFIMDLLHKYQTEGPHELDTPYGHVVPYYEHDGGYYPYAPHGDNRSDYGYAYTGDAHDPYTYLHHRAGIHDGDDTYLGVQRSHDHDVSMEHHLQ